MGKVMLRLVSDKASEGRQKRDNHVRRMGEREGDGEGKGKHGCGS